MEATYDSSFNNNFIISNESAAIFQTNNATSNITGGSDYENITAAAINGIDTAAKNTLFGLKTQYTSLEAIITGGIMLSVIVVTIIGNILVCLAVFLVKKLRKPCNYLLVSLAVSDICVAILVMPMAMLYDIFGRWNFGNFVCDLWVAFDVLSCTASILNLCMISVDRYYAITKPLEYGVKRTPKRMILCVSLVWLGAACISLPPLLILGNEHEVINGVHHCLVCQNFGYQIYATLGSFYIPLTVMMMVYYKIFCAARRIVKEEKKAQYHLESNHCYLEISVKNGAGPPESRLATTSISYESSPAAGATGSKNQQPHRTSSTSTATICSVGLNNNSRPSNESQCPMLQSASSKACQNMKNKLKMKGRRSFGRGGGRNSGATLASTGSSVSNTKKLRFQLAKERKASTTLGIIMSAFIICWLPFFVLALVRPFLKDSETIPASLSSLFLWLGYANSLLNPIIYATLNRDFRRPFQQILFFRCGSLNHMMREEFYHSQYGDPDPPQHFYVNSASPENMQNFGGFEDQVEIVNVKKTSPVRTLTASESFL